MSRGPREGCTGRAVRPGAKKLSPEEDTPGHHLAPQELAGAGPCRWNPDSQGEWFQQEGRAARMPHRGQGGDGVSGHPFKCVDFVQNVLALCW